MQKRERARLGKLALFGDQMFLLFQILKFSLKRFSSGLSALAANFNGLQFIRSVPLRL